MARFPPSRIALGLLALLSAAPSVGAPPAPPSPFVLVNEAEARGVHFVEKNFATDMKYPFETLGGAVAAFDYDRDGFVDLLFLNGAPSPEHLRTDPATFNRLFRNTGKGQFADVTEESGLSGAGIKGYPQGVAVGDYDNDGYPDVLVTNYGDNVLYHNATDHTGTILPYNAAGQLVNINGLGTVNGVSAPRIVQLVTRLTF